MNDGSKPEKSWVTEAGLEAACWFVGGSHRCGYVKVPEGSALEDADYNNVRQADGDYIDVHGGLTFGGRSRDGYPGEGDAFWLGFDCAHFMDAMCGPFKYNSPGAVHRSQEYVEAECERLAKQLLTAIVVEDEWDEEDE